MKTIVDVQNPEEKKVFSLSYYEMLQKPGVYKCLNEQGTFVAIEDGVIGIQGETVFVMDANVWEGDRFVLCDDKVNLKFSN